MSRRPGFAICLLVALAVAVVGASAASEGLAAGARGAKVPPPPPMPPPGDFVKRIDNKYLPWKPGTTFLYRGMKDGERAENRTFVTRQTKTILGVEATVVLDRGFVDGKPEEKTFDWYAQDKRGNVWYLGEDSFDWKNGRWVRNDGSWEAGVDGARAGIIMEAGPKVGDTYRQEFYKGHAEDLARVLSLDESVDVPYGRFDHCLQTREWTPLEPGIVEQKFYARGVGEVRMVAVKGEKEEMELVSVSHDR
jgi:hypothetical protein